MSEIFSHEYFMKFAFQQAEIAKGKDEIPVGAIIITNNTVIARAHNMTECLNDVTAHAEMLAITAAANHLGAKYLDQCSIYVTLEPCLMCASALFWAKIQTVVWGAPDPLNGFTVINARILHPKTKMIKGIMEKETSEIIKDFFIKRR